jgi:TonB family protein
MKAKIWFVGVLLVGMLPLHAQEKRERTFFVGAEVDAKGQVTVNDVDADAPPGVADLLKRAVVQWHFVPAQVDGKPVSAHTFIRARLIAMPNAQGNYDLRVSFGGNGPKLIENNFQPTYPPHAIRMREQAFVLLDAAVQPDGSLADMKVSSQFEHWPVHDFEAAVREVGKHWRAIPEQVDGKPVVTRVRIPFAFTFNQPSFTADQVKMLRQAAHKEEAADAKPGIPLPADQPVALDSPLQPSAVATISAP